MRGELRLSDLKNRDRSASKLMNVKIPAYVSDAIQRVATDLGASKTEVVIALLNEGLEMAQGAIKRRLAARPISRKNDQRHR